MVLVININISKISSSICKSRLCSAHSVSEQESKGYRSPGLQSERTNLGIFPLCWGKKQKCCFCLVFDLKFNRIHLAPVRYFSDSWLCIHGQNIIDVTCTWNWTEMLIASFPSRAKTTWIPLRIRLRRERCRLGAICSHWNSDYCIRRRMICFIRNMSKRQ